MSVIIKGKNKPTRCADCFMYQCGATSMDDCPLVPVKEYDNADAHAIVLDKTKAFKFEMDDEEAQEQVIRDAKKYGLAVLKPKGGEWIAEVPSSPSAGYLKLRCSECEAEYTFVGGTGFFFCPTCGSAMRGVNFGN